MTWRIVHLLICLSLSSKSVAQSLRLDLQAKLQNLLCAQSNKIPVTNSLWKQGVYDMQMDAAWVHGTQQNTGLDATQLEQIARSAAKQKQHAGFAYGICSPKLAWFVTSHAQAETMVKNQENIEIRLEVLRDQCLFISLHYANGIKGRPKLLTKSSTARDSKLFIQPKLLAPGTISLTCHPMDKRENGPELWTLFPIHGLDSRTIPLFTAQSKDQVDGLITWIQNLRASEGLIPLRTNIPALRHLARQLISDKSIRHPHALLLSEKQRLASKKLQLIGENRVKAATTEQMAWLLWYSPTHRKLLLDEGASALGFQLADLRNEKLLVLVTAKL